MHKIDIPQSIVDACIARRGKQHVFDAIDPGRTALVVIDMQNSWVQPAQSVLEISHTRSIVPNINRLAAALRAAGGVVAWTKSTFPRDATGSMYDGFGTAEWIARIVEDTAVGSPGHRIADCMDLQAGDIVEVKNRPSAFIQGSSNLEARLRERGCDKLIITGTLTNACCESSARDAAALGFQIIFVSDATATRSDIEHNATLINLMQLVADVRSTQDVLGLIEGGDG